MKKTLSLLSVLTLLFAVGCGVFFGNVTEKAEEFLSHLEQNEIEKAYELTSQNFKDISNYEIFENTITAMDLDEFTDLEWISKSIEKEAGATDYSYLGGEIMNKNGIEFEIIVILSKEDQEEDKEWKIEGFEMNYPQIKKGLDESATRDLINKTMFSFEESLFEKNFENFIENELSILFKNTTSTKEFKEAFLMFENLFFIREAELIIEVNEIMDTGNTLILKGQYADSDNTLFFDLKYVYEKDEFKLFEIDINLNP
jgi:hypothetical protein